MMGCVRACVRACVCVYSEGERKGEIHRWVGAPTSSTHLAAVIRAHERHEYCLHFTALESIHCAHFHQRMLFPQLGPDGVDLDRFVPSEDASITEAKLTSTPSDTYHAPAGCME
jgi:hypothetical protein